LLHGHLMVSTVPPDERYYRALFEQAPSGYIVLAPTGAIIDANATAVRLLRSDADALVDQSFHTYLRGESGTHFQRLLRCLFDGGGRAERIVTLHVGDTLDVRLSLFVDVHRVDRRCLVNFVDVSNQRAAERATRRVTEQLRASNRELSALVLRDPLTRLLNRRGLQEQLRRELARAARSQQTLSALLVDCDQFKRVNDRHGLTAGDQVLREVANRLTTTLRPTDVVSRVGGDEFIVLLPKTELWAAMRAGERVRRTMANAPIMVNDIAIAQTISLGAAVVGDQTSDVGGLLALTQRALATSKHEGRNQVSCEDPVVRVVC
jgi:diguanylate cyclase (GGDEF)-like protein/PAS domain S-box-containing protein